MQPCARAGTGRCGGRCSGAGTCRCTQAWRPPTTACRSPTPPLSSSATAPPLSRRWPRSSPRSPPARSAAGCPRRSRAPSPPPTGARRLHPPVLLWTATAGGVGRCCKAVRGQWGLMQGLVPAQVCQPAPGVQAGSKGAPACRRAVPGRGQRSSRGLPQPGLLLQARPGRLCGGVQDRRMMSPCMARVEQAERVLGERASYEWLQEVGLVCPHARERSV